MLPQHLTHCTPISLLLLLYRSYLSGDAALVSLCQALQLQSHLTSVDLSGNTISDDGAAALLQALAVQHKQCKVAITSKNMTPSKRNSSSSSGLTTLDIGHNLITSTGGKVSNL
jgi:Leucine Rich repeat